MFFTLVVPPVLGRGSWPEFPRVDSASPAAHREPQRTGNTRNHKRRWGRNQWEWSLKEGMLSALSECSETGTYSGHRVLPPTSSILLYPNCKLPSTPSGS